MLNLAIIFGGPSKERGISLNSARSFLDHTVSLPIKLTALYVDTNYNYHLLSSDQLYSNTPSDFDFKLHNVLSEQKLVEILKNCDLVFPLIHGKYGEDGTLQKFLEKHNISYVGTSSAVCQDIFNKYKARELFTKHGFNTQPYKLVTKDNVDIEDFAGQKLVVKPTNSGSSIGVKFCANIDEARKNINELFNAGFDELIIEPYCEYIEFTTCVLESHKGQAVALIPSEIDIGNDSTAIFDYRRKYLPTEHTRCYCPPRFSTEIIEKIRSETQRLFTVLGLRDCARIDGWLSPSGEIYFSDLNPISGMEQNSFFFQQSARVGMSHSDVIIYIINNALQRYNIQKININSSKASDNKKLVYVVMGGATAERQVSLMSGTNIWLKLRQSKKYTPTLFLLDKHMNFWKIPYALNLYHTVEEVLDYCHKDKENQKLIKDIVSNIQIDLNSDSYMKSDDIAVSKCFNLQEFIALAKNNKAFIFIGLHGGDGENGHFQEILENNNLPYNGSGPKTSKLCMDKHETSKSVALLNDEYILPMKQVSFLASELYDMPEQAWQDIWQNAVKQLGSDDIIIKPTQDGCSAGVVRLSNAKEFIYYIKCLQDSVPEIPIGHFIKQDNIIEMPINSQGGFLLEPYIITDKVIVKGAELLNKHISGWGEITIGVLESKGQYHALNPSITVAEGSVLSLEEKFQGGTGVNITPPPEHILPVKSLDRVKNSIEKLAKYLGIQNYARIDIFVENATGRIIVIEANSLPAMTPSTVIYHQALRDEPSMNPIEFLEWLIDHKIC